MFSACLILLRAGDDPLQAVGACRRLVRAPLRVHLLVEAPTDPGGWGQVLEQEGPSAEQACAGWAARVTWEPTWRATPEQVRAAVERLGLEAVLVPRPSRGVAANLPDAESAARAWGVPSVWLAPAPEPAPADRAGLRLAAAFPQDAVPTAAALLAELRPRLGPQDQLILLALGEARPGEVLVRELEDLIGPGAPVSLERLEVPWAGLLETLERWARERALDAIALAPGGLGPAAALALRLLAPDALAGLAVPLLLLPTPTAGAPRRPLDLPDALALPGAPFRLCLEERDLLGQVRPAREPALDVFAAGRVLASLPLEGGRAELPQAPPGALLGLSRRAALPAPDEAPPDLRAVEATVRVVHPGGAPVALLAAELDPDALARAHAVLTAPPLGLACWFVRTQTGLSCRGLRERLEQAGWGGAPLLDAGALLGDRLQGLPPHLEGLRLERAARRLRAAGLDVALALGGAPPAQEPRRWLFLGADALADTTPAELAARLAALAPDGAAPDVLGELTDAALRAGNRVSVELDNDRARRELLELLERARERIHLQCYIVADDPVTRAVERALVEAAERGVAVRVLIDSLWSHHGSFGQRNPLLERLERAPGVELRLHRPLDVPSVAGLKQRDHRKLVIVDGEVALVSGRNLAACYYTGYGEVDLGPETPWEDVPWFDASARVEGPLVEEVEASFASAWAGVGGEPLAAGTCRPRGSVSGRLVVHRGLRDARSLDAYLALIDGAVRSLTAANTFPLEDELQSAFLRALERGVAVRFLIGSIRPRWGRERHAFPGSSAVRDVGDQLVRARLEPLVAAGADVRELALRLPSWEATLGQVFPQVHAKLLCADGRRLSIGSANLDLTAGYWESEALLVLEDPALAGEVERHLDYLLAASPRLELAPGWEETAARRANLVRYWPDLFT